MKKSSRDWDNEKAELAAAIAQLELMKLWLAEHQQSAAWFTREFKKFNARLNKLGEIEEIGQEDDMIEFKIGVDRERWRDFKRACNVQARKELSPEEVEKRAFDIWTTSIDAVIKYHRANEPLILTVQANEEDAAIIAQSVDPAVATSWENEIVNPSSRRSQDDGPAIIV